MAGLKRLEVQNKQGFLGEGADSPQPPGASAAPRKDAVTPFPRAPTLGELAQAGPLAKRIIEAKARRGVAAPQILPSELVTSLVVTLPRTSARQRAALLAFAVEERVGVPIDTVVVAPAQLGDPAPPGAVLALVIARSALASVAAARPATQTLPDFLALRRPEASASAPVWAVWREGERAVVRCSDGTGFAVATDALPALWVRGGRPALVSLGAALPSSLPATDLSHSPPAPDPLDLAFSFRDQAGAAGDLWRPFVAAASIAAVTMALHLGLAAVDAVALGRIARSERAVAEAALAPVLPGVTLDAGSEPILARLAPVAVAPDRRSDFLSLLAEVSVLVGDTDQPLEFRRLSWGAEDGILSLLVQGADLDDLQVLEQALRASGLHVRSGAASAGDGGAEVEMRVSRGGEE